MGLATLSLKGPSTKVTAIWEKRKYRRCEICNCRLSIYNDSPIDVCSQKSCNDAWDNLHDPVLLQQRSAGHALQQSKFGNTPKLTPDEFVASARRSNLSVVK